MKLTEKIRVWFRRKAPLPAGEPAEPSVSRPSKACRSCGKMFTYDPAWEHIPNYCKECRKRFVREREEKQRSGAPRKIKRKCKACGKFFTFPNTLEHYPNYCSDCRKRHKEQMKEKYRRQKT